MATYPSYNPRSIYGTSQNNVVGQYINTQAPKQLQYNLESEWQKGVFGTDRETFLKESIKQIESLYSEYVSHLNDVSRQTIGIPGESVTAAVLSAAGTAASLAQPFGLLIKGFSYVLDRAGKDKAANNIANILAQAQYLKTQLETLQSLHENYRSELLKIQITKLLPFALVGAVYWFKKRKKAE